MARSATMSGERSNVSDQDPLIPFFADLADDSRPLGGAENDVNATAALDVEERLKAISKERTRIEFQYPDLLEGIRGLKLTDRDGNPVPLEAARKLFDYARDPDSYRGAFVNPERYHVATEQTPEQQTTPDFWARKRTVIGSAAAWFASQRYAAGLVPDTLKHTVMRRLEHTAGKLAQRYKAAPTQVAHTAAEAVAYRAEQDSLNEQYRNRIRIRMGERAARLAEIAGAPARREAARVARRERREESKRKTEAITHAVEIAQGAAAYYPRNLM